MSLNGSGPDAVATAVEARKTDQLASEITSEHSVTPTLPQAALISAIKEDLAQGEKAERKADEHYRSAGRRLKELKASIASWAEWESLLKDNIGIGKSRASELMAIADGTKTVAEIRASKADSMKRLRAERTPPRGGETLEPGNSTKPPKLKSTSQDQRELEAARAYAAELEAAREHDGDLAEQLQAAKIKIAGLESEVEELKAENARLREQLTGKAEPTDIAPKKRGRPKGSKNKPKVMADTVIPEPAHDVVAADREEVRALYQKVQEAEAESDAHEAKMAALDDGSDCGPIPESLRRAP